ncbi:MAG: hydroxymethylglutaryl-CoA lyase [Candidatus Krumholzibacteria bacterium]|jgi:hydroxymethylglutaryl-CoA lyase|nr:hydroxymethylglutaryl-CoA lyase [Candidatus Krumholzibacteria bacterium]
MQQLIIHEVGPRDGLQVEKQAVPFERKVAWIEGLAAAGVDIIQLGSFVHPEKVPQMADTDRLFTHFSAAANRPAGVVFSGLVLNERGLERGLACGVDMFCMGVSASETHSRKNTGMSPGEALARIVPMAKQAQAAGKLVQVSVQSAFGCGFEGPIPRERVLALVQDYLAAGVQAISLADTAGHANPAQVEELLGAIKALDPAVQLTAHFHNTYGLGLANCWAAMKAGARSLEAACGGLGGCPFTKVPAGNVSTEDLVHTLQRMGLRRDIDLEALVEVARDIGRFFDRELPGFILRSGSIVDFAPASPA